jgi:hypothetical protein
VNALFEHKPPILLINADYVISIDQEDQRLFVCFKIVPFLAAFYSPARAMSKREYLAEVTSEARSIVPLS